MEEVDSLNITSGYERTPDANTSFNVDTFDDSLVNQDKRIDEDVYQGAKQSFERAALEPIYAYKNIFTNEFDDPFYKESFDKTLLDIRERQSFLNAMSNNDSYGVSLLRYLPETYAILRTPFSIYSTALKYGFGSGRVLAGGTYGGAEGLVYFTGRENYRDPSTLEYLTAVGIGASSGMVSGNLHRGYMLGKGQQPIEYNLDDLFINSAKGIKNVKANASAFGLYGKAKAITAGGLIAGGTQLDAGWFDSASKVSTKSTADVAKVMAENVSELGDAGLAFAKSERDLVPSLSDYQIVDSKEAVSGFLESIGYEVGRAFRPSGVDSAIDDIIAKSTLHEKNQPLEAETILRNLVDELYPQENPDSIIIRDALGRAFRTGANADDIKTFMNYGKVKEDIAMADLINKVGDLDSLNKAINDIVENIFDKTVSMPHGKNSKTILKMLGESEELSGLVDDVIRTRALAKISPDDMSKVMSEYANNPRAVEQIFGFRDGLNKKTDDLISAGSIRQEDADFAYSSNTYKNLDNEVQEIVVSAKEFEALQGHQGISNALYKLFRNENNRILGYEALPDGTYKVRIKARNDFVQGPVVKKQEIARGEDVSIEPTPIEKFRAEAKKSGGNITPSKLNAKIIFGGKERRSLNGVSPNRFRAVIDELEKNGIDYKIESIDVTGYKKPMSPSEQARAGLSDDIADVGGKTVSDVQRQLGIEASYTRIRNEYSANISKENGLDFTENFDSNPEYLFISVAKDSQQDVRVMQTIANNYLKIDDPELANKVGASYVSKKHAFTLLGYNKMYATQYTFGTARFVENMYRDLVGVFRSSVVLKNPVSMVNNIVSMAFTNFAYQYMKNGSLSGQAFTGLSRSYGSYKDFVNHRAVLVRMKASGASQDALLAYRKQFLDNNSAYKLYKEGGLQSLLDDGLANRAIRDGADGMSDFEYGIRSIFLSEDTKAGAFARKISDIGDITNRINMFDELVKGGMSEKEAAKEVSKMAVNYTRLLSPSMQFARDMGIAPFATWFTRFMPEFAKLVYDNPMRAGALQGMYLITQGLAGSEDRHGNNYIAGVNTQNWWAFNAFAPDSITDVFNGPVIGGMTGDFNPKALIPAHLNQIAEGRPRLVTTQ